MALNAATSMEVVSSILSRLAEQDRVTIRRAGKPDPLGKCVVYWMQRSQRGVDNHALDVAIEAGNALDLPVVVFFAPVPFYPHANLRHYAFLQQGVPDIREAIEARNCGFVLRRYPDHSLTKFLDEVQPALLIGDENPLRETERWRQVVAERVKVPFWTVDSDVVVPSKLITKAQFGAYVIRPRLREHLPRFLVPFKNPKAKHAWIPPAGLQPLPADTPITDGWKLDRSVPPVTAWRGGTKEALRLLKEFVECKIHTYPKQRNHPETDGTSRLSPYLHFGHIGPVTVALAVMNAKVSDEVKKSFLDELVTWRELAVNFVKYNENYDNIECAENWSRASLAEHARDRRDVLYTAAQLEAAQTHDPLWNAAHLQMVHGGWMHNYMRMYWAKKLLEWTPSPAAAFNLAVKLNDKYELDGRDPNGYAGVAWAITGKHDRAWFDRPIFGKVRYMSGKAAEKKFNVHAYIEQVQNAVAQVSR